MRITITSVDHGDSGEPEVYHSLESLRKALLADAGAGGYTEAVLRRITAGETRFSIPNGPNETDYYKIEENQP
jgi:hypothetical protein